MWAGSPIGTGMGSATAWSGVLVLSLGAPTSAGTLTLESYQSLRVFTVELHGSKNAVSGWITAPSPNQE